MNWPIRGLQRTDQSETSEKNEKTFILTFLMSFRAVSFVTNGIEFKTDLFF